MHEGEREDKRRTTATTLRRVPSLCSMRNEWFQGPADIASAHLCTACDCKRDHAPSSLPCQRAFRGQQAVARAGRPCLTHKVDVAGANVQEILSGFVSSCFATTSRECAHKLGAMARDLAHGHASETARVDTGATDRRAPAAQRAFACLSLDCSHMRQRAAPPSPGLSSFRWLRASAP